MPQGPSGNVTELLQKWHGGDREALDALLPAVWDELRKRAAAQLRSERPDHTLQPTALVNEAYLRLVDQNRVSWEHRAHFFAIASRVMRRILIDHARKRLAHKRGDGVTAVPLTAIVEPKEPEELDVLDLHEALKRLADLDKRQARIVEMRYFGGLTVEELAHVVELSPATVKRDLKTAKAWLHRELRHA